MEKVRLAIPKGHLAEATLRTLERAGYVVSGGDATYRPTINDPMIELKVLRPQEIPVYVSEGLQDLGVTGKDWLRETSADVEVLLDLEYSWVKLVLAIPKPWTDINSLSELLEDFSKQGKTLRISTEYLNIAAEYLKKDLAYKALYGNENPFMITP